MKFEGIEICTCPCHEEGRNIMHAFPCCNLCYQTYLDKGGNIIPEKLQPILRKAHLKTPTTTKE